MIGRNKEGCLAYYIHEVIYTSSSTSSASMQEGKGRGDFPRGRGDYSRGRGSFGRDRGIGFNFTCFQCEEGHQAFECLQI